MDKTILDMKDNEWATITEIRKGANFQSRIAILGLRIGKRIKLVTKQPIHGPVVIQTETDGKITLGHGMALGIMVKGD